MKKILLFAFILLILGIAARAQSKTETITDKTSLVVAKNSIKVVTSDEELMQAFLKQYYPNFTKYTVERKKDRLGYYNQYSISFKLEGSPELREFLTSYK